MSEWLPLAGIKVLDLSAGEGAAGSCVRLLAQLGGAVRAHDARGAPGLVAALAGQADLTVTDLRAGEVRRLGLALARLGGPGRAVVSVTPFGLDGPEDVDAAGVGTGRLAAAATVGVDPLVAISLTGAHAAAAGLAALRWARRTGRAALAEVATLEVVAACLGDWLPRATCPRGAPGAAPTSATGRALAVLPCVDGYVGLAAPSAVDRDLLAGLTGVDAVRAPAADLASALGPWLAARTRAEVFHAAQLWRLPAAPVLAPAEVYGDAQCVARGVWTRQGGRLVARSPFRFARGEGRDLTPPAPPLPRGEGGRTRRGRRRHLSGPSSPMEEGGERGPLLAPRHMAEGTPLGDVCVLDLGMVWAGPWCGRLLAGLGARVVKVEGPARRDGTRPAAGAGCASAFADLNRGKEGLALDLASAAGRDVFLRLAAGADMVVENFSPRVMPNFGLDYGALAQANPRLLMLSLPAFGASGPWRDYVAYGSGLELATGLAATVDGRPTPAPVAYLDYLAGASGAVGLLAALLARDRSGCGAHVELAQREVACQVLAAAAGAGRRPAPWSLDPAALRADARLAARGLFAAAEGHAATAAGAMPGAGPAAGAGMVSGPGAGAAPCQHYARLPWRLHGVPERRERAAPAFGADSRRVLREVAGLAPAEIDALVASGTVWQAAGDAGEAIARAVGGARGAAGPDSSDAGLTAGSDVTTGAGPAWQAARGADRSGRGVGTAGAG